MLITNYYRGGTDLLSGFTFDTDKKSYKMFSLKGAEWTDTVRKKSPYGYQGDTIWSVHKPNFKTPGDLSYWFTTKSEMQTKLKTLKQLGFTEDNSMVLNFGILIR